MSFPGGAVGGYGYPQPGAKKKRKVPTVVVAAAAATVLLVGGYVLYLVLSPSTGGTAESACYLLIDRTASAGQAEVRDNFHAMADAAVDGCADDQAVLMIGYFDQAGPKLESAGTFEVFLGAGRVERRKEAAQAEAVEAAKAQLDELFDSESGDLRGSDVMVAMRNASENLSQTAVGYDVSDLKLIVLTDGLQMSNGLSVESLSAATDIDAEIARAQELDLLPALEGVEVFLLGPGGGTVGADAELEQEFEAQLKRFWTAAVDGGSGSLCRYVNTADRPVPGACPGAQ